MQGENLKSLSTRGSSGALPCPYIPALSIRAVSEIGLGREDWRRCQKIVTKVLLSLVVPTQLSLFLSAISKDWKDRAKKG
jgi:hypothetical protein